MKVEVLAGPGRRRRWTLEEKFRIVEESLQPGVTATGVARQHGLSQSLIFWWRRQSRLGRLGGKPGRLGFVPVALPAELPASCEALRGVIEIDLGDGRRVRVDRAVDAGALRVVLSALERR